MISKKSTLLILAWYVFLLYIASCQCRNVMRLEGGGYTNVLVAIQKDVEEDQTIIDNLKTMFTDGSVRLFSASRQQVYWKEITILVPVTWTRKSEYGVARTETLESSNILIHNDNPMKGDQPYVDNPFGCGQEGLFIHLTPRYILEENFRESKYGATDKVLVRNWGKLRWGLYDEHYEESMYESGARPAYDAAGGGTEGTRCSLQIYGNVIDSDGNLCRTNPNGAAGYPKTCQFIPDQHSQTATASLLFGTQDVHVYSITDYCDNNQTNSVSYHNRLAPNLHNKLCKGKSAWEVMDQTDDFRNGNRLDVNNTTPTFNLIQPPQMRSLVLVLDISGSMSSYNRFDKMIQSSTEYIMNIIPDGSQLGIVVFSTSATVNANLTQIQDEVSRQTLVSALPTGPTSLTCIGCGILSGINVLGRFAAGGYILLLSDGAQNVYPYIADTYDDIETAGVIIDTIAVSSQADQQMESLSNMTGGVPNFCPDTDSSTCLIQAFQSTITKRPDLSIETVPIQIYSSDISVSQYPDYAIVPVIIDTLLGNDTVMTITWLLNNVIHVVVDGPDETRVDQNDTRYHLDLTRKIISVKLPTAQAGQWNIVINNTEVTTEYASVAVTSKPKSEDVKPVIVDVILGSREVDYSQNPVLAIYATVQSNYQPVLDATVEAIIDNSNGLSSVIELFDNGAGSDLLKMDGIYSRYFLNFTTNGRYNVKVNVLGSNDDQQVAQQGRVKRSAFSSTSSLPSFMRTASGGVFQVRSYTPNAADRLPPSRILDLMYSTFSYDNSTVTLVWTAVGDDLDQGTASGYELRYATNSSIWSNFTESTLVTDDYVVRGNLSFIAPAGAMETVTVLLREGGDDVVYYFAIRAWDDAGNVGDASNIASLAIRFVPQAATSQDPTTILVTAPDFTSFNQTTSSMSSPSTNQATTIALQDPTDEPVSTKTLNPPDEPNPTENPGTPNNDALIIGVSCALGVVVLCGTVGGLWFYHSSGKRKGMVHPVDEPNKTNDVTETDQSLAHTNPTYLEA